MKDRLVSTPISRPWRQCSVLFTTHRASSRTLVALAIAGATLLGQYAEARKYLAKAIEVTKTDQDKTRALRSMAMSYAFESNRQGAAKYAGQAFDIVQAAWASFFPNLVGYVAFYGGEYKEALAALRGGHGGHASSGAAAVRVEGPEGRQGPGFSGDAGAGCGTPHGFVREAPRASRAW